MKNNISKAISVICIAVLLILPLSSCKQTKTSLGSYSEDTSVHSEDASVRGIFLGVANSETATRDVVLSDKNSVYQFEIDGEVKNYRVACSENDYSIQNRLMKGYEYQLKVEKDKVVFARVVNSSDINGIVEGFEPGKRTVKNFLKTAVSVIGKSVYVYGGGWNFQDDGSSYIARTIGISPTWEKFYKSIDANYSFENDTYPKNEWNTYYYAGLDCSGYVGWVLYNTMYKETEKEDGFVCYSTEIAKSLAEVYNYGKFEHPTDKSFKSISEKLHSGDVVSIDGHVYIILGVCDDGSILILHSTVTKSVTGVDGGGVQISALSIKGDDDKNCEAYLLAEKYMNKYRPEWVSRYPVKLKPISLYFDFSEEETGIFTWNNGESGLTDSENIKGMTAEKVLETVFGKSE